MATLNEQGIAVVDLDTMSTAIHDVYCGIMADHEHPNDKDRDQARQLLEAMQKRSANRRPAPPVADATRRATWAVRSGYWITLPEIWMFEQPEVETSLPWVSGWRLPVTTRVFTPPKNITGPATRLSL